MSGTSPVRAESLDLDRAAAATGLVDVVSGSFGAGHDAAAREIAARFRARGYTVRIWDVVDLFPARLGELVRAAYLRQLKSAPSSWETLLNHLEPGTFLHGAACRGLGVTGAGLLRIAADGADVIVSTHPFASQTLGRLRAQGRLGVPVVTYLTDMSVHPLWVHRSVDRHLALHEIPAQQARRWGATVTVIRCPVAQPDTLTAADPRSLRSRRLALGLPPTTERLALVTGGSMGIGEMHQSALDIAATGLARPVVLCGHNSGLYRRLGGSPGVVRLGWRDDLPAVLAAVDCVVQNAGGFISLEALAAGTPTITYRGLPGHGRTNADALDRAGLIPWARCRSELAPRLVAALDSHPFRAPASLPDVVDAIFPWRARIPA